LRADIEAELALQQRLKERLDYVKSDAFVERWAREEGHMVQPGDRLLIPVTPAAPPGQLDVVQPPDLAIVAAPVPNWHHWWRLFLDTEPGKLRSH
jgi:hypothetical protein